MIKYYIPRNDKSENISKKKKDDSEEEEPNIYFPLFTLI